MKTRAKIPRVSFTMLTDGAPAKVRLSKLCLHLFKIFSQKPIVKKSRASHLGVADLSVVFVGAARLRRLNRVYRKKDYATDVLSFSSGAKHEGLGELVLCIPVLKRQAHENGHSLREESEMMLVHGFLHLLGYDHEKNRKEELKMMGLQDKILKNWARARSKSKA